MSTSVEAFHVLRCAMLTSHAVVSICHYLLGIGDRHLSNFMINLKTGQMVGIDFGHAFGTATQVCVCLKMFVSLCLCVCFLLKKQNKQKLA